MKERSKVVVLGAGSWGTALARMLAQQGHEVRLWCRDGERADEMRRSRRNPGYLSGYELPPNLVVDGGDAIQADEADILLFAVPVQALRGVLERVGERLPSGALRVSASKGIERITLCRVSEVLSAVLGPGGPEVALSGPSFADEVARADPTAITVAARDEEVAERVQGVLASPHFRVYTTTDVVGVEIAGALKNVMAIACGIIDGLGLGTNARAALLTRGLAEMTRLGMALGGERQTFMGLAGMGDLVLTATGDLSRNRRVGMEIGRGARLDDILESMNNMVAEGVETSLSALELAQRAGVEMPITREVKRILFECKPPLRAVRDLMTRHLRPED